LRILTVIILAFLSSSLVAQSKAFILDRAPNQIYIKNDSLMFTFGNQTQVFDGSKLRNSADSRFKELCQFDPISAYPSFAIKYNGYDLFSYDNKLYNSCKSAALVHEFGSTITGLSKDLNNQIIISTSNHGFHILDKQTVKSYLLPSSNHSQNISSFVLVDNYIVYASEGAIYKWSMDNYIEEKIYSSTYPQILLTKDAFKQLWIAEGNLLSSNDAFIDLSDLDFDIKQTNTASTELIIQIENDYAHLFTDLQYEYSFGLTTWYPIEDNQLIIHPSSDNAPISIRAKTTNTVSNVHNFRLQIESKDQLSNWFKYISLGLAGLVLTLLFLLWKQRNQQKIVEQKINSIRTSKRLQKTSEKLFELQMNPHFLFNALNSTKGLIANGSSREARKAIDDISSLMRLLLDQSRDGTNSIDSEIKFLTKYISLERLAYPHIEFNITCANDISLDENIPSMMVQPFVENAIKHGLSQKMTEAKLELNFMRVDGNIICKVSDNGHGRKDTKKSSHNSHATQIVRDRIQNSNKAVSLKIEDLKDAQGKALGTTVVVPLVL